MKLEQQVCSEFRKLRGGKYHAIHKWLIKHFGKANKCENPTCEKKSKRYQWTLIKDKKHFHNRTHYRMLCQNCHRQYDDNKQWRNNISRTSLGRRKTLQQKQNISKIMKSKNYGNRKRRKGLFV